MDLFIDLRHTEKTSCDPDTEKFNNVDFKLFKMFPIPCPHTVFRGHLLQIFF